MKFYYIYKHFSGVILLLLLFDLSCKKPETLMDLQERARNEVSMNIKAEATVPSLIYTDTKKVNLDASKTTTLNGQRNLFYTWTCTSFPVSAGRPVINNAKESVAWVENPGIGQYKFHLLVNDNLANFTELSFTMDVLLDTIEAKRIIVNAGPDKQIYYPKNELTIQTIYRYFAPSNTYPPLTLHSTILEKPAGNNLVKINNANTSPFIIANLTEGVYKIQSEVKNELGSFAYDTVEIRVSPDPLKGTVWIYENMIWKLSGGGLGEIYVDLEIYEADLFKNRHTENFEVRVWDEIRKDWSDAYQINAYGAGYLYVYPPYTGPWPPAGGENDPYYKIAGTKVKVQVKIL